MGLDDLKTKVEKAAGPIDDKAKEMWDDTKQKVSDMGDNADDKVHQKGGEVEGNVDQYRRDHDMDDDDVNRANPLNTGVDADEYGEPGRTPARDLDDNPLDE